MLSNIPLLNINKISYKSLNDEIKKKAKVNKFKVHLFYLVILNYLQFSKKKIHSY